MTETEPNASRAASSTPQLPLHAPPLIGRQEVMALIQAQLQLTRQGQGSVTALKAASGIGKSRMAHEALNEARRMGMLAVFVPCRGSVQHPYHPLAEIVRALLDVDPAQPAEAQRERVRQVLGGMVLGELTGTVLKLLGLPHADQASTRIRGEEEPSPTGTLILSADLDVPDAVLRLFHAWGAADRSGAQRGMLVIFDDLDQASEVTRTVFADLRRMVETLPSPVYLVATFAPDAPADLLGTLEAVTVEIKDLLPDDAAAMAASLLGATGLSPELSNLFWHRSAGRPLLIRLLAQHLQETGSVTLSPDSGQAELSGAEPVLRIREIVAERIRLLSKGQREMLLAATVLGDGVRIGALRAMRGEATVDEMMADLSALVDSGWLEASGVGRLVAYRFAHAMLRDMIYRSIPPEILTTLHAHAGDYYAVPATGRRLRFESALYHYERAKQPEKALNVIDLALIDARRDGNREQLISLYQRGAQLAAGKPDLVEKQAAYAEALGDLYAAAGDYQAAANAYAKLGPKHNSPVSLLGKLGLVLIAVDPAQAVHVLSGVVANLSPGTPDHIRSRVESGLVWSLALTGRSYEAVRFSRDSLARLADTSGLGSARTLMRGTLGMVLYYSGDEGEAHPHLESARAGWGARSEQDGVLLMNQVLVGLPRQEITRHWLRLALQPLLRQDVA